MTRLQSRSLPRSISRIAAITLLAAAAIAAHAQADKPAISLDEYFNTTTITGARLSPDGTAAVIATEAPDWKSSSFRSTLSLWTSRDGLRPLTQSGSDLNAQWSPDGKWIAFESDRPLIGESSSDDGAPAKDGADGATTRIWLIPASGGEAQPLYREKLDAHTFAWSPDGKTIYLAVTTPLTHEQEDAKKEEWKDVVRWREQERGDLILALPVAASLIKSATIPAPHEGDQPGTKPESEPVLPATAVQIAQIQKAISELAPSPDGKTVAFVTDSISHRMESPTQAEIYLVPAAGGEVRQLTHNEATESDLQWSPDGKSLYFLVRAAGGSLEGKYRDVSGRIYRLDPSVDPADKSVERLGSDFTGTFEDLSIAGTGAVYALGIKGTEEQLYLLDGAKSTHLPGLAGSYTGFSSPHTGNSLLVRFGAINHPTQVYLAADASHPDQLTPLTSYDPIFAERAQPDWRTYQWKAPDGATVEGVLIFPPGKKDAKHLRMLTLIHGGPADADGNRFGADWYDWATLAATNGWLVFRPNYRGSSGYGDDFMLQIAPHLVSKPGEDILAGVDQLVKDGLADPDHLAIGGYSYGGYMTNWLITQTTRFKAAVTGAGAVEHAANWGNDDETYDDSWYLGGQPWEVPAMYASEAALFQMNKVKTPTHLVQGGADIRVSYLEGETFERALQALNIPHTFLVFPGEGHGLGHNPWHGYIKVRDELDWLEKYCGK